MVPHTPYKIFWIIWILAFCVVEFMAVRRAGGGDTFSEFVWWVIGTGEDQRDVWRWTARIILLGVLIWIIPHFYTKWNPFR